MLAAHAAPASSLAAADTCLPHARLPCVRAQTTRDKLYELQADLADRVADIKERDATIEGLQATVASLGDRMVEKDAEIARLEPFVGQSEQLGSRVEELEESLEKARAWSDGMVDRFGELHYMLHQASDGKKPSDLENDGASALAILKERERRAATAKANEEAAARRRAQARDAAQPGAVDGDASADAAADAADTSGAAGAGGGSGGAEAAPAAEDEETLKKEQEAFAAMDPESRAYLRRVETAQLLRQKRGKAAEDMSWLEVRGGNSTGAPATARPGRHRWLSHLLLAALGLCVVCLCVCVCGWGWGGGWRAERRVGPEVGRAGGELRGGGGH